MNRKSKMTTLLAGVVGLVFSMYGSGAFAGIVGSTHDFSSGSTWNTTGEICATCHTPHNAVTAADGALWDREASAATYTVYSSPLGTLDATVGSPAGASKLCLSCHDGTVAMENFGGTTGAGTLIATINPLKDFGIDLSDDHPISFAMAESIANGDGQLNDPASGPVAALLISGQVECASCHDVHNNGPAGAGFLLRVANNVAGGGTASGLCLTCHNK